jgi:tRNA (adenine22-N1)-methyltransferase
MQLSQRLKAVADSVTFGNQVADVGCDHAYISIYLIEHDISPQIIALDVNKGPLNRAQENIYRYGYDRQNL